MKTKQRTHITLETLELTIVRVSKGFLTIRFCGFCRENVRHLPIAFAALLLEISEIAAFRLAENKQIHSTETETGALLICQKSLLQPADAVEQLKH